MTMKCVSSGKGPTSRSRSLPIDWHTPGCLRADPAALKSGKRHLMFSDGPPGTGKTSLAELVAGHLHTSYKLVTGSADWSSQDVVGGYQPTGQGGIRFTKGVLLEHFDQPLIIDELNRCDIDRVLGPLFTVLSGQPTTLPYLLDPADDASERYVILPEGKAGRRRTRVRAHRQLAASRHDQQHRQGIALPDVLRLDAALRVDPDRHSASLVDFMRKFCVAERIVDALPDPAAPIPLAKIWTAVNAARPMGAAPFIDTIRYCRAIVSGLRLLRAS